MEYTNISSSQQQTSSQNSVNNSHSILKIMSINVNSIQKNKRRFELNSRLTQHDPDVLFICETKLKESHKDSFKNYSLIRTDRPRGKEGGGTATAIKNHIKFDVPGKNDQT